ncbi:MAG: AAA family ATPase [Clostridia bacterium]
MEITGEIKDIIYKNEINSYTIADFETDEEETTIVGYLPFVNPGDTLKLIGKFVEHKDYGRQFKIDTFEKLMPQTLGALERYLAKGNIKGIGEAIAKRIIRTFGGETIHVFKYEPERLATIRGISKEGAKEMSTQFIENWEVWQIVGFLERFGIGAEYAKKVFDLYGTNAIEEIESNPYILIDLTRDVDFRQIDKMALDLGISYDNDKRIESGIKYGLIRSTYNGNSCVLKENLIEFVIKLLDVTTENVEDNLINLKAKEEIVIEKREDSQEYIYLTAFYNTEEEIAYRLLKLQAAPNLKKIGDLKSELTKIESTSKIELSEKQKEAIKLVNESNVTIITGGPGTGKTTIIKNIIDIYEGKGKKVVLSAPTGRAAKRMTETTGKEASTLHRLLEIGKIDDDSLYKSTKEYEGAPIDGDIIIVDEVSMVDMFLMSYLLKCVYQGTKLVLVGDVDQLASVGPGSVLEDLIDSEQIPTIHLDKIFRQAAKSKIVLNAHRVNSGKNFLGKEEIEEDTNEDFFFIKENSQERMLAQVVSLCTGRLEKFGNYDFFQNIQVLSPTKKGILGTKELNKILQQQLNPNKDNLPEKSSMGAIYRIGDRVMQVKNNYDLYWEKEVNGKTQMGSGIFNGEIGTITGISEVEKQIEIKFDDDKTAWYEFQDLD